MGKWTKVARWEIRRNLKNKTFIISSLMTPAIFLVMFFIFGAIGGDDTATEVGPDLEERDMTELYVMDEAEAYEDFASTVEALGLPYEPVETEMTEAQLHEQGEEQSIAYLVLGSDQFEAGVSENHTTSPFELQADLELVQQSMLLGEFGVEPEAVGEVLASSHVTVSTLQSGIDEDPLAGFIPAIFGGVVLLSIIITGMMTLNSSMQEKKDKMAETLLSSVTPNDMMKGKIFGYFVLGMLQVTLWLVIGIPIAQFYGDLPVLENIVSPLTLLFLLYGVLGYLFFASMYVALGATIEDATTAGNFTGIFMMLPFLPFPFIGAFIADPSGVIATVASYFPFTSSMAMIVRVVMLDEFPLLEVILSLVVLIICVALMMKIAGKIYKTGMLMHGKNATPAEMWKWIRQ
ncbi:ABC transporter permease [Geomicrobium sp. JSM 1781026]|uniref:ABC transporter permease n=2 Tax=unclassified Geomicrobium TaxID=2628951 RepID=UPI0035C0C3FC